MDERVVEFIAESIRRSQDYYEELARAKETFPDIDWMEAVHGRCQTEGCTDYADWDGKCGPCERKERKNSPEAKRQRLRLEQMDAMMKEEMRRVVTTQMEIESPFLKFFKEGK